MDLFAGGNIFTLLFITHSDLFISLEFISPNNNKCGIVTRLLIETIFSLGEQIFACIWWLNNKNKKILYEIYFLLTNEF